MKQHIEPIFQPRAFLFSSVPDGEVPTDWVITSVLYKVASGENIQYIIGADSLIGLKEGNLFKYSPNLYIYMDRAGLRGIIARFTHTAARPASFLCGAASVGVLCSC